MPLKEHLLELRRRLVIAAIAVVIGAIVGWIYYDPIYEQLSQPFRDYKDQNPDSIVALNFANPTAAFSQQLSISIFVGILLASPVWMYQIWAFIMPGLTKREKRVSLAFFAATVPLFAAGCIFAYYTLPKALLILYGFTPDENTSSNIQSTTDYFTFVTRFILAFGAAWLLPVVLVALAALGILSARQMLAAWRPAVLLIFVAAAIITPTPDPFTMFLLAGPLVLLYFGACGIAALIGRKRQEARPDWLDTPEDEASTLE
ncbi:twin-arginine translocase subunit TatC [Marihabitans asiaticum]|uniref:Sec-independent protein translocase protein TatC n=2 Tax=Marihabitans asiaticum TaxID=415218 RepID=A0A560W6I1_9MICO|nr:twin-arginine translocase subunit TatC [Marihabitans asiaticum]TWD13229.1 Sec-independent protein translocase TatC [Marihabitans asiaticum]